MPGVRVVEADAMTLDWDDAARRSPPAGCSSPTCPYNVATPLVCDLLDGVPAIARMLVMVQREVAERLARRARLAGLRRGQREGRLLGDGPHRRRRAGVGVRAPPERRVGARRDRPPARRPPSRPSALFPLVRTAFGQRRKMLRRSLAGVVTAEQFVAAGVAETARPEELGARRLGAGWRTAVGAT